MSNPNFYDRHLPVGETVPFLSVQRVVTEEFPAGVQQLNFYDGKAEFIPLSDAERPSFSTNFQFGPEPRWNDGTTGVDAPERAHNQMPLNAFYDLLSSAGDVALPSQPTKPPRSALPPSAPTPKREAHEPTAQIPVVMPAVSRQPNTLRSVLFGEDREVPVAEEPTKPRLRDHLRDTVLLDLLGFQPGDSPSQQLLTGLWEMKNSALRNSSSFAQAGKTVTQGTAELAKEAHDNVKPRIRQAAVVATAAAALTAAVVGSGISPEHSGNEKAEPAAMLPIERVSVTVPITSTDDLNTLADSLLISPEEMAVLAQKSGIAPGEISQPSRLTLQLPSSTLELKNPTTAEHISKRFGLPTSLVIAANPGSEHEPQSTFDIPGRTLFTVNTETPNISGAAQIIGIDPTLAQSLNTVHDGVVALPSTTEVSRPEQQAVAMALLAPVAPVVPESPGPVMDEGDPLLQSSAPAEAPDKPLDQMTDHEYMQYLADQVNPTIYDLFALNVDTSRMGAFDSELSGQHIQPQKFVGHWTAGLYERGVDQFIDSIKGRPGLCCNVTFFMDKDGVVYQFADPTLKTSHAKGANSITQGVEIEARNLRDYTPLQMRNFVLLAYRFMREQNIPIERPNFTGHQEVDVIHAHRGQKIDMPTELVDLLFPKLKSLDDAVRADEANNAAAEQELQQYSSQERYDMLLDLLLAEISKGEGGVDSVNQGHSGDTPVDSAAYRAIFGDRKLSDLTIAEVMDLQARSIIFTAGTHQLIPVVLKGAVKFVRIDVNRKFDAAAQKELGIGYLIFGKRKYLAGYINGENYTLNAATQDLCQEFASMPCPDGRGFYDGDSAGNRATRGVQRLPQIRGLLTMLRQAKQDVIADMKAAATVTTSPPTTEGATTTTVAEPRDSSTTSTSKPGDRNVTTTSASSATSGASRPTETTQTTGLAPATKMATKPVYSPTMLPVDTARQVVALYLGSAEAANVWVKAQDIITDATGENPRVLVDTSKLIKEAA